MMPVAAPSYSPRLMDAPGCREAFGRWQSEGLVERLWESDPTVWGTQAPDAGNWLGWLGLPRTMGAEAPEIIGVADRFVANGVEEVVLMGMGGSSLAPEMFFSVFGSAPGRPRLTVLDSTHPEVVESLAARIDPSRTLFLVSSKSGTTVETLSFYRYFWDKTSGDAGRFVAITDSGTPLDSVARERGFAAVFNPPPDVGGRFSAFTAFGLAPAALIGVDLGELLERASAMADRGRLQATDNPAVGLGLVLGAAAASGMDKLTLRTSSSLSALASWMEQLVAESLGKKGVGTIPVAGEPVLADRRYGIDRVFLGWEMEADTGVDAPTGMDIRIDVGDPMDLGAEIFRAELAIAAAGEVLGVNPFDQPDVEAAKRLASAAMARRGKVGGEGLLPAQSVPAQEAVRGLVEGLGSGEYLGIQAYVPPSEETEAKIAALRRRITEISGVCTTFGYGPRYLHSTGQAHKGGPPGGAFLQFVDDPGGEVQVPGADFGFARLISAQAEGDYSALLGAGRRILRVNLGTDRQGGMESVLSSLD